MIEVPMLVAKVAVLFLLLAAPLGVWHNSDLTWTERVLCGFLYPILLAGIYAGVVICIFAVNFIIH